MRFQVDPDWQNLVVAKEAEARGEGGRLRSLAYAREADGFDPSEAETLAGEALGLVAGLDDLLREAVAPLEQLAEAADFAEARGEVPTLRQEEGLLRFRLPASAFAEVRSTANGLVTALGEDPERLVVTLMAGVGGTGGCACGDELPQDSVTGPLFAGRERSR